MSTQEQKFEGVIGVSPVDERTQILNDMQRLIDWLRSHPEVNLPHDFAYGMMLQGYNQREELTQLARSFGECEKEFSDESFYLRKRFGSVAVYAFTARNQVCERVVVGTEEIPERVSPAYTREIVEWQCTEPLLGGQ
jgi:hypothetical protein